MGLCIPETRNLRFHSWSIPARDNSPKGSKLPRLMGRCILSVKSLKFHFAIRLVYPLEGKIFLSEEKHSRPRKSSLMTTGTFCGRLYIHPFFSWFRFWWKPECIRSCAGWKSVLGWQELKRAARAWRENEKRLPAGSLEMFEGIPFRISLRFSWR